MKFFAAASVAVGIAVMATPLLAADYKMKVAIDSAPFPENVRHYRDTVAREMAKEIEERSDGRIEVSIFWNGQLGKLENVLKLIGDGHVEATLAADGPLAPYCPDVQIFGIPYLFIDRKVAYEVLDGEIGQDIATACAKKSGILPVWLENGGYRHFSSNKPIESAADMRGMKMRTMNIPVHMKAVQGLGASATPIPWSDLYTSLQTGVVDGQENALATFRAAKLEEVQDHIILDGHVYGIAVLALSQKWLDGLPEDLRTIVLEAAEKAKFLNRDISVENEMTDRDYLVSKGVSIYDPTLEQKAEFQSLSQAPALELVRETVDPALLDQVLSAVKTAESNL